MTIFALVIIGLFVLIGTLAYWSDDGDERYHNYSGQGGYRPPDRHR